MTGDTTRSWLSRPRHLIPVIALTLGVVMAIAAAVSPWPATLLIRAIFTQDGQKTVVEMNRYVPATGVDSRLDVAYAPGGPDTTFDVFSPSAGTGPLPTVVWIHGGAWVSGDKGIRDPYAKILAAHGYTVVSLNYTVAPEAIYPTALTQLNTALGFLSDHAADYRIDPQRMIIAGDSAGSQLTSQLATMITSPAYARKVGIAPALRPAQLRGVILDCGVYDISGIPDAPGLGGWGFRVALWAYLGQRDWTGTPGDDQMSTVDDVTVDFPATWISGGNGDPLTKTQSKPMAARLQKLGVDVTELFFPADTKPALPHEYQFHLDGQNAQKALTSTLAFMARVSG